MSYTEPNIADFKTYFERDFPFGTDISQHVLDADLTRARKETKNYIAHDLFEDQDVFDAAFLNLMAHNLVINLKNSAMGIKNQGEWMTTSKSVGSVSTSQQLPQAVIDDPQFAWYSKTGYGINYLSLVLPRIKGAMFSVKGGTHA